MNRRRLLCLLFASCLAAGSVRAVEEDDLQELWKLHLAAGENHEAAIKACQDYTRRHADDALLPMVRGVVEWHLLRGGHRSEAQQMMAADLTAPAGAVQDGARRIALAWATRADRQQVVALLQSYYRKEVAYPKSIEQALTVLGVPENARPPMKDHFGQPWQYALTGFAKLQGFADQKYSLQSTALGDTSDFKGALELPYASRIVAVPTQIVSLPGENGQAVKFNLGASESALIGVGRGAGELYLAYVGAAVIVVCDYTHWKVIPRP